MAWAQRAEWARSGGLSEKSELSFGGLSELVGEGSLSVGGLSERSALLLVADGLSERTAYAPWTQ